MLGEWVAELASSIVGDAILESIFPGSTKPEPAPREGMWNASLGSLSAFLSGVAAPFCGASSFALLKVAQDSLFWALLGGSVLLGVISCVLAARALRVTARRRRLAHFGLWLGRATVLAGGVTAVLAMLR